MIRVQVLLPIAPISMRIETLSFNTVRSHEATSFPT